MNFANKSIADISRLAKRTDYNVKISEIENKIPEIENKMPSSSGLATTAILTAIENKIPDVSSLVKKADYDWKILYTESKYITTAGYNKFTKYIVANNIKNKNLVDKLAIAGFINNANLDEKK